MIFNCLSNQQILILMSLLFQNQESLKKPSEADRFSQQIAFVTFSGIFAAKDLPLSPHS